MKCEVRDNLLFVDGVQVEYLQAADHGKGMEPDLIVEHYTGDNSLEGALSELTSPGGRVVSSHLVIAKDGTIYQLLPFNVVGWHAGESSYYDEPWVNRFSIGIENVGFGDNWPDAQIEANRAIIEVLFNAYPIRDVVGHSDVAPGRKVDPGPNFPWDKVTT